MPRNTSSQNITYRDPLDSFTDREEVLKMFRKFLRAARPGQLHVFAVKGNSGTGKTFLIFYLTKRICPEMNWQTSQISFTQSVVPDFRLILAGLEEAFESCVPSESLKQYREKRDEYRRSFDDYRTSSVIVQQFTEASSQSSISSFTQTIQVNAQLRERELQLRYELTRALTELAEESTRPLCLFIDGYDRLLESDPELDGWLWEMVLLDLIKASPQPLLVVTCGWEQPNYPAIKPFTQYVELTDFDLEQVRNYLKKQGVITSSTDLASPEGGELVPAFYELTKGHPLVLNLAVTYFKELDSHERTAANLRANRSLIDERARVEFLEERILSRLPEPYRTLLERGPILRYFDQGVLEALLSIETDNYMPSINGLDDRTYDRFLRYPFIIRTNSASDDPSLTLFTFHPEIRRIRLEALRHFYPQLKEQLNRRMADFYSKIAEAERVVVHTESSSKGTRVENIASDNYYTWLTEISENEFKAQLENLYHALQVKELQIATFESWEELTGRGVDRWRRRQAKQLLELVRQLAEEDEPFLQESGEPYARYSIWYAKFLGQEARWEEARGVLEQATKVFDQVGKIANLATCLNNIGIIYEQQGKLEEALSHYEQALAFSQQVDDAANIVISLNNMGIIYKQQGKLEEALSHYEQALAFSQKMDNPTDISISLNSIGFIYRLQGKLKEALSYYERALTLNYQVGNPANIAQSLNNVGSIHHAYGELNQALDYYKRALNLSNQVGNPADIAQSLNNIGSAYHALGKLDQALDDYKQALKLREQIGNPVDIAQSLNNIGFLYSYLGDLGKALSYYNRALALYEQVGNPIEIGRTLSNVGSIYLAWGRRKQALEYLERALKLSEQVGNPADIAFFHNNIGIYYQEQGELEQALQHHNQALKFREQLGNPADIAITLNNIGIIYQREGRSEQALSNFTRALTLSEQVGNPITSSQLLNNIGTIYQMQGKLEQAIKQYTRALSLYEHLGRGFEEDVANNLELLTICYVQLGDLEKGKLYYSRAKQMGRFSDESTQETS